MVPVVAFAQLNNVNSILSDDFDRANNLYDLGFYDEAILYYSQGLEDDPSDQKAIERLATSYMKVGEYRAAYAQYSILFDLTAVKNIQLIKNFAETCLSVGDLEKSTYWFQQARNLDDSDQVIVNKLEGIQNHALFFTDTSRISIKPVSFNTEESEFGFRPLNEGAAIVSSHKNDLIIHRNYLRSIETFTNVYTYDERGQESDSTRTLLKLPGYLKSNDGPISQSDRYIAISRNTGKSKSSVKNTLGIYVYTLTEGEWKFESEFTFNSKLYSNTHPWLNSRGDTLYFASDMPGGQGGFDIYYSVLSNYEWSEPRNLGKAINTSGQELFPMRDGYKLYFTSNGLPGLGGLDNYVLNLNEPNAKPINLGYPLNTGYDDIAMYASGDQGYLSSNRPEGKGFDDIYTYSIAPLPPKGTIDITVIDKLNNLPVEAVHLGFIYQMDTLRSITERDGFVSESVNPGSYKVLVNKEKYKPTSFLVVIKDKDLIKRSVYIDPIIDMERIAPDSILFALGKYELKEGAKEELNEVASSLKKYPMLTLKIAAYTDSRGTKDYNQELSNRRAEATYEYLLSQGIDSARMTRAGYGETMPLNRCVDGVRCSEEEHAANRRIEFLLKEEEKADDESEIPVKND